MSQALTTAAFACLATCLAACITIFLLYRQRQAARLAQLQHSHTWELARLQERAADLERSARAQACQHADTTAQLQALGERLNAEQQERSRLQERAARLPLLQEEQAGLQARVLTLQQEAGSLNTQLVALQTQRNLERQQAAEAAALERKHFAENLALLRDAKTELAASFKSLANDILTEKTQTFTLHNKANMEAVLAPLHAQLDAFRKKVDDVYVNEAKDRSGLATQVKQLMELNSRLSTEADNLTRALKGSSKVQGDWGEVVLERILEESGMRAGQDYVLQESHTRADGSRVRPDVVINLPDEKTLVVDAKVSLGDYLMAVNAAHESERAEAMKRHVNSVREHVKGLSKRNYQTLHGSKSIDFVLMFIPIEPAFMAAIGDDATLWSRAWDKDVLLVSPSTLLFVLRTVAHLWRQEQQQQNALQIAQRGAELYNKFVGFVEDLQAVGDRLRQAQDSHDKAFKKLTSGRGNLVGQADKLRALGVKASKKLRLLDHSSDAADASEETPELLEPGQGELPLAAN